MKLERMSNGAVEIASPIFHGSITLDAARELAARLTELADRAESESEPCTATDPRGRRDYRCCYREGHSEQFAHRFVEER